MDMNHFETQRENHDNLILCNPKRVSTYIKESNYNIKTDKPFIK